MGVAFVFPGQGAQVVGMGRDLYDGSAVARAIFDRADAAVGFELTRICFEGPEAVLTATENVQPALLTTSMALLAVVREELGDASLSNAQNGVVAWPAELPLPVAFVAGHSLGEYSALAAAGALDLETAVRLVRRRGELMAQAHEGTMAAVIGMDEAPLEEVCAQVTGSSGPVVIANYNAPGQLVISGATAAVEQASILAKQQGARRVLPLKVSAAFHSPLMREAADGLAPALDAARIESAQVPLIANVTAQPLVGAQALRNELREQVTAPVRWIASVERMVAEGVDTIVELGPGAVLSGLIKRIAPGVQLVNISDLAGARAFAEMQWTSPSKS